jgi:hypothetical protein
LATKKVKITYGIKVSPCSGVLALAEVVGYDVYGTILCVGCAEEWAKENGVSLDPPPEGVFFIFDDNKWDYIPTCKNCEAAIDVAPTSDGLKWLAERLMDKIGGAPLHVDWIRARVMDEITRALEEVVARDMKLGDVGVRWLRNAIRVGGYIPLLEDTSKGVSEEDLFAKMRKLDELMRKLQKRL